MEKPENILWQSPDGKDHLEIYSRVLQRHVPTMEDSVYRKLEKIYSIMSFAYFQNRPEIDSSELDAQLGDLHDNFETGMFPLKGEYMMNDGECELRNALIEGDTNLVMAYLSSISDFDTANKLLEGYEPFTSDDLKSGSNESFDFWAKAGKLGDPNKLRFEEEEKTGVPHIETANDYMGKQIYHTFQEKIKDGDEIRVLDLGGGTGGTTEAIIHWVYECAKRENMPSINMHVETVEFNDGLAKGLETKKELLEAKYSGCRVNVVNADMQTYISEKTALTLDDFDVVSASYSIHHLLNDDKKELLDNAYSVLKEGGLMMWADPNEGKSDINKSFFNLTDEGTFASFTSHEQAKQMLEEAGFISHVASDAPYISEICSEFMSQSETDILMDNCHNHNGFVCIGVKCSSA